VSREVIKNLLFLVLAGYGVRAGTPQPDVVQIVQRSVASVEANWNQAPNYSFKERDVESKHSSAPTIKSYEVSMIEGSPCNRLVAFNDQPLAPELQAAEEQKLRAEIDKRQRESHRERAKRIAKYEKERHQDHAMMIAMADAFDFQLVGEETINGHACWVLDATPKHGYQPKIRETKVLTGMRGRLWIDKAQYQWVRVRAQVFKGVGFFGFVAKVAPGTAFALDQEPVADNLWLPKHFRMQVKASALGFINEDSTADETYGDYRLSAATMATIARP
jgi:hypothetical protein